MKITRALLLKASPFAALIAGFTGGALAISPLANREAAPSTEAATAAQADQGEPVLQMIQAQPLVRAAPSSRGEMQLSFAPVVDRAGPAVVNVYAARVTRGIARDPFFGRFSAPRVENSLGSGVIVRNDGIIVTNNHVIEGAQSLKVVLSDRREFDAELLLADPRVDLAVLRINTGGERLPMLPFADTQRDTQVGDLVLAIGNPYGLERTVTSGIISALARTEVGVTDYAFFIQTDAAVNRGNSGGALVDMNGALVGINSAIFSETGGSNGIGFAIPAEMVRRVVESAVSGGREVVRPWLGARLQGVTADLARSLGLSRPQGVLVTELYPRSSGERAGLQNGDVILAVAGNEVNDEGAVRYQFATQRPGSRVPLSVRRGERTITLTANAEAPPGGAPDPRLLNGNHPLSGARVVTLTPSTAERSGLDPFAHGVFIQELDRRGVAARIGFRPGDIIDEVNGQQVRDAAQVDRLMAQSRRWEIGVQRNGQRATLRF